MRTVADLISARASLRVTCRNCDREGYFTARFLKARLGYTGNVLEGRYRCSKCRSFNVSLCPALAGDAGRA